MEKVCLTVTGDPIPPELLHRIRDFAGNLAAYDILVTLEPNIDESMFGPDADKVFSESDFDDFNATSWATYPLGTAQRVRNTILRTSRRWRESDDERLRRLSADIDTVQQSPETRHAGYLPASVLGEIVNSYGTDQQIELRGVGQQGVGFLRDLLQAHGAIDDRIISSD